MNMSIYDNEINRQFNQLQAGDKIELSHEVKVGSKIWNTTTSGTVVRTERRRHGLHHQRNSDDKVFSDMIVMKLDDGSLTTATIDEFSQIKVLARTEE